MGAGINRRDAEFLTTDETLIMKPLTIEQRDQIAAAIAHIVPKGMAVVVITGTLDETKSPPQIIVNGLRQCDIRLAQAMATVYAETAREEGKLTGEQT